MIGFIVVGVKDVIGLTNRSYGFNRFHCSNGFYVVGVLIDFLKYKLFLYICSS